MVLLLFRLEVKERLMRLCHYVVVSWSGEIVGDVTFAGVEGALLGCCEENRPLVSNSHTQLLTTSAVKSL